MLGSYQQYVELIMDWLILNGLDLVVAFIIMGVGYWFSKKISRVVGRVMERLQIDTLLVGFFRGLVYWALLLGVSLAAVSHLGVDITSFLAIVGSAALAIALAVKDNISNVSSGVLLIFLRPFTVGDYVEAGGTAGTVKAISLTNTIMSTPDNRQVIVPNAKVMTGVITNYNANPTRRIDLVIGVGYEDDLKKANEVITRVVTSDPGVLADPKPLVAVSELADSSVNFNVRPWCNTSEYWAVRYRLLENIKLALDDAGISIPYPQQDVYMHQA